MLKNKSKYIIFSLIILFAISICLFCACADKTQIYTVEYIVDEGGYLVGDATQTVEESKNGTTITAVASEGYRFACWSDGKTEISRKETAVTEDKILTALFVKIKYYTVEYVVGEGGYIVGNTAQTVEESKNGTTVTAVAIDGYRFTGWSDGTSGMSRKEEEVNEDKTITAQFVKLNYFDLTYNCVCGGGVSNR